MRVASQYTKLAIPSCYKSVNQKLVVDDRKESFHILDEVVAHLYLVVKEPAVTTDVTISDHLLMSQVRQEKRI